MYQISVIIPAYNAEKTILQTLDSVQKQTFSNFEIIVINDGSTDRTLELLQSIQDERLKIFSYENGGLPVARNRGIERATGDFFAFLDADDLWTPDKLELQLAALQKHPEAGVAYSWTYNMNEQGQLLHPVEPRFEGDVYNNLLLYNFLSNGSNPLIRRQAIQSIGEFDTNPALKSVEDWDYWLRLALKWHFVLVPKHQVFYRRSSTSMSSKIQTMKQANINVIEKAFSRAPQKNQSLKKQSLSNIYQYYVEVYLENMNSHLAEIDRVLQNLWQAIRLYPLCLLSRYTQMLVLKVILIRLFSPAIANRILLSVGKVRKALKPQLQV